MAETTHLAAQQQLSGAESERSAEAIRRDIAAKRESISDTVDKLGNRIHQTLDWREYVVRYPFAALGIAAGTGFFISGLFRRRPKPGERIAEALADLADDLRERVTDYVAGTLPWSRTAAGKTLRAAARAAIAKATLDFGRRKAEEMIAAAKTQTDRRAPLKGSGADLL